MTKDEHKKIKKHAAHHTSSQKKVFDVTRPGKAPASPTSRPVIASPKPAVPDDQFVPSAPPVRASDPFAKHDLMNSKKKKAVQPLNGSSASVPADTKTETPAVPAAKPATAQAAASVPEEAPAPMGQALLQETSSTTTPAVTGVPPVDSSQSDTVAAPATPSTPSAPEADSTNAPNMADAPARPPAIPEEETPAHLALEQTVDAAGDLPIWEHPATSQQVENPTSQAAQTAHNKSIEDLLAETGAPILEPEKTPSLIVSHHNAHRGRIWKTLLVIFLILLIAGATLDLLLDADILTGVDLPHTELIN